jgi:hypothetical protein
MTVCHSERHVDDNKGSSASDIIHAREGEFSTKSKQSSRIFDVKSIVGYNLVNKETVVPSEYTWLIVVHHKTTAAKISQSGLPVCCILISLIGRIHEVSYFSIFLFN